METDETTSDEATEVDPEYYAPGPVEVSKHIVTEPSSAAGFESPSADPRAVRIQQEREVQNQLYGTTATADPATSVLLTEIQELKGQLTLVSTAALTAVWLGLMIIGYSAYTYYAKRNSATGKADD